MSSELRKEYSSNKRRKEVIVEKSAYAWVEKNVVLINEKIDRRTIKRLIDSIVKFDEKFSLVKAKLPSVAKILDDAETSLNLVLSGKTSDSRAEDILKHLSIIYTLLSDFFSGDLPIVLRAPMFRAAKENPEVRLDSISAPNHNPKMIAGALETALRPSKEEIKLMSKVYRGIALPSLNASGAANEMLGLTYKELEELTTMGRIPMVTTPDAAPAEISNTSPELVAENSDVAEKKTLLEEAILLEQNSQTGVDKLETLVQNIDRVKAIIDADPTLKAKLSGSYEKLRTAAIKSYNDNAFLGFFKSLQRPGDLTKSAQGKVIAQAEMAVNMFRNLGQLAPTVEKMVNKDQLTADDVKLVRGALSKALKGGLVARAMNVFKTQPFPGLAPDNVIDAVVEELEKEVNNSQQSSQPTGQATQSPQPGTTQATVNESKENFINAFKNIAKTSASIVTGQDLAGAGTQSTSSRGSDASQGTSPSTPGGTPAQTGQPTTSGQPSGQGPSAAQSQGGLVELQRNASDGQLAAIQKETGISPQILRKISTTRGLRLLIDPEWLKVK